MSKDYYKAFYSHHIQSINEPELWKKTRTKSIHAPAIVKQRGYPLKDRQKDPEEFEVPGIGTKKLRRTGTTLRYGSYENQGHNRNTCHKYIQDARGPRDSTASSIQEAAGSSVPQPSGVPRHSRSKYKAQSAKK